MNGEPVPELVEILERSRTLGLLGPMPIVAQIDHTMGFAAAVEASLGRTPTTVVDLGSGGGVPGLVIARHWGLAAVTLLDSSDRRVEFLQEAVVTLDLGDRVTVVHDRAESFGRQPGRRECFEVVTARSFAAPAPTAESAAPLLRVGGVLVVSEPPTSDAGRRWPGEGVAPLGLELVGTGSLPRGAYHYQSLRKVTGTPDWYPRKVGTPAKRPLF